MNKIIQEQQMGMLIVVERQTTIKSENKRNKEKNE
jgi:hypothetical protein